MEIILPAVEEYKIDRATDEEDEESDLIKELAMIARQRAFYKKQDKILEQQEMTLKRQMLKEMEENDIKTFSSDGVKFTYVKPYKKASIDTAKLKEEMPEIAQRYTRESEVGANLKITVK